MNSEFLFTLFILLNLYIANVCLYASGPHAGFVLFWAYRRKLAIEFYRMKIIIVCVL